METKGRSAYIPYRKRLKWWLRNNTTFLIIIAVICAIVALIFGMAAYNFERVKSMEAILDKNLKTIHRKTGLTDSDVEKLRQAHPGFNWEKTWDRERWLEGEEKERDRLQMEKARQSYQLQKKEDLYQLKKRENKARGRQ
jgi:Na+-transporting NADH:ubiquinone oxidoreductase subunit NqrC